MSSVDLSGNKCTYLDLLPKEIQDKIWYLVHKMYMVDVKSELSAARLWIQLHPFAGDMDCKRCRRVQCPCGYCPKTCTQSNDVWLEI